MATRDTSSRAGDIFFRHNLAELWTSGGDWAGGPRRDHSRGLPVGGTRGVNTSRIPDASHSLYGLLSPTRFRPLTPCDTSA